MAPSNGSSFDWPTPPTIVETGEDAHQLYSQITWRFYDIYFGPPSRGLSTLVYHFVWGKGVLNGCSSTRVSLWDSLMFGRLAT